jgi:4-hydroxy-tetrahydrodipicolinate synthase
MTRKGTSFEGVATALVTPMRDGAIDGAALAALVEEQIGAGVDALVAVGTTGESATLPTPEHIDVVRQVVAAARGRVPVIAGAGANATAEAIELGEAAEAAGADALLHVAPYYNRPGQEGMFRHFQAIAGATRLPIILYNVPSRTSCDLGNETVERLAAIDNVVAIKDATGDLRRGADLLARVGDRITLVSGDDATAFPYMAIGARGVVSVVSNVLPGRAARMCRAALAGRWDEARAEHLALLPLAELLFAEPSPAPTKAALAMCGKMTAEVRLPITEISPALERRLRACLLAEGLIAPKIERVAT